MKRPKIKFHYLVIINIRCLGSRQLFHYSWHVSRCNNTSFFDHRIKINIRCLGNRQKVTHWSHGWLIAAGAYHGYSRMERLAVFLLPLDGMLVHRRSLPHKLILLAFPKNLPVPIYTPGVEGSTRPKNKKQCPRPGFEPGPLALESSALTTRPPRLS